MNRDERSKGSGEVGCVALMVEEEEEEEEEEDCINSNTRSIGRKIVMGVGCCCSGYRVTGLLSPVGGLVVQFAKFLQAIDFDTFS